LNNLINNKFFTIFFAPFLLGAITILGFAPYNLTFVNFFTFSTLLFLISVIKKKTELKYRKKQSNRYFFYLGCSFGFGFFLFGNYWISISLTHDEIFKVLIPFSVILVPLFLSLFFGLAILIASPFCEKNFYFVLLFSLIFSIFEFLRGNLLTGFPWNLISYTLSWSVESIQILSLIGTYSLSLVLITFFCAPFILLQRERKKKNFIILIILSIIFVGNYVYGLNKIKKTIYSFDQNITVKVVSPNFSLKDYNSQSEINQLKRLIKISDPDKTKKTLFIWPEGAFYESYLQNIKIYKDLFFDNFSENHLIVLGINNFINNEDIKNSKYYNSLVIVNNKLEIVTVYNKIKLVPFGEFLPFKYFLSKLGLKTVTQGYNSFSAGNKRSIVNLGSHFSNILILPLICYEVIYSGKIKDKNQHPDLVINISEDAWFGDSIGPDQHYTKSLYRAVEEGVFIARSANKGISGFIDPNGRALKILDRSESGNVELKFPNFFRTTFYSEYGNKIFVLIILIYIFLIFMFKKFKI
jgi:apolipoprotein N-acyltransferase